MYDVRNKQKPHTLLLLCLQSSGGAEESKARRANHVPDLVGYFISVGSFNPHSHSMKNYDSIL